MTLTLTATMANVPASARLAASRASYHRSAGGPSNGAAHLPGRSLGRCRCRGSPRSLGRCRSLVAAGRTTDVRCGGVVLPEAAAPAFRGHGRARVLLSVEISGRADDNCARDVAAVAASRFDKARAATVATRRRGAASRLKRGALAGVVRATPVGHRGRDVRRSRGGAAPRRGLELGLLLLLVQLLMVILVVLAEWQLQGRLGQAGGAATCRLPHLEERSDRVRWQAGWAFYSTSGGGVRLTNKSSSQRSKWHQPFCL